jgi:site-specific recombinase
VKRLCSCVLHVAASICMYASLEALISMLAVNVTVLTQYRATRSSSCASISWWVAFFSPFWPACGWATQPASAAKKALGERRMEARPYRLTYPQGLQLAARICVNRYGNVVAGILIACMLDWPFAGSFQH